MGRYNVSLIRVLTFIAGSSLSALASAEITLSQLIVELAPGAKARDVEIYNDAEDRAYVVIEPRQILNPGQPTEGSVSPGDPERLGLLVSPRKLILEAHQRRLIRIADIGSDSSVERIYRVTVKPQVGDVKSDISGLKLLVGYDMLVIARPAQTAALALAGKRTGNSLVITNRGSSSVELDSGQQCRTENAECKDLGGKRLYAGASWTVTLPYATPAKFKVHGANGWTSASF